MKFIVIKTFLLFVFVFSSSQTLAVNKLYRKLEFFPQKIFYQKDFWKEFAILFKAASSGDSDAQFLMSVIYELGYQVPIDSDYSRYWLSLSAKKGNKFAIADQEMRAMQDKNFNEFALTDFKANYELAKKGYRFQTIMLSNYCKQFVQNGAKLDCTKWKQRAYQYKPENIAIRDSRELLRQHKKSGVLDTLRLAFAVYLQAKAWLGEELSYYQGYNNKDQDLLYKTSLIYQKQLVELEEELDRAIEESNESGLKEAVTSYYPLLVKNYIEGGFKSDF